MDGLMDPNSRYLLRIYRGYLGYIGLYIAFRD